MHIGFAWVRLWLALIKKTVKKDNDETSMKWEER